MFSTTVPLFLLNKKKWFFCFILLMVVFSKNVNVFAGMTAEVLELLLGPEIGSAQWHIDQGLSYLELDDERHEEFLKALWGMTIEEQDKYEEENKLYYDEYKDLAIAEFTEAIQVAPAEKETRFHSLASVLHSAYIERGKVYRDRKNDYELAIKDFTEAIRVLPDFFSGYGERGYTYRKMGNYDKAIEDYSVIIGLALETPSNDNESDFIRMDEKRKLSYVFMSRGNIYMERAKNAARNRRGDYKLAIQDFTNAIQIWLERIEIYEKNNEYGQVNNYSYDHLAYLYILRAQSYHVHGNIFKAKKDAQIALQYIPDSDDDMSYSKEQANNIIESVNLRIFAILRLAVFAIMIVILIIIIHIKKRNKKMLKTRKQQG